MMEPPEYLAPADGYERVRRGTGAAGGPRGALSLAHAPVPQIQHLQSGAFGMAYLERDLATGELVAIKYIPRGDKVRRARGEPARTLPLSNPGAGRGPHSARA